MGRLRFVAAAGVPAGLYVLYVWHYAVNVPYADDWNMIPIVVLAAHRHLAMTDLWSQYGDTRLFVPKLFFALFAVVGNYNIKVILMFSAMLFVASYLLLLLLLRSYLAKRLTFVEVFVVGIVWFSLADLQNALWSFQLAWYLATFFFVAALYFLLARGRHGSMLALGIVAAVAASYSIVQGFVVWPVGLICVLWSSPWGRRTYGEAFAWLSAAAIAAGIYLRHFDTTNSQCTQARSCTTSFGILHPQLLGRYIILLFGNVIPTSFYTAHPDLVVHEFIGAGVAVAAVFVVVQTIRERRAGVGPLPLVLIMFGILFDLMIALGRFGDGPSGAVNQNRYTMPNLVLLAGIVIYACAHLPSFGTELRPVGRPGWLRLLGFSTLCVFLLVQFVAVTEFGIKYGRATHQAHETDARVVVNLDVIPAAAQSCDAAFAVIPPENPSEALYNLEIYGGEIAQERLSLFQPAVLHSYRAKGPPDEKAIVTAGDFAAVTALWAASCS